MIGAGDLEVHVAEMILVAENVRQHSVARVFQDEAHRDASRRPLQGNTRIHQRQRSAADRRHRRRPVRFGDLRDHAHRVGKFVVRRQYRVDRAPGELAVADLAPLGAAKASGFTDRVGREIVMQQERLFVGSRQRVDILFVLTGAERGHHHRLRLAAGEKRRAVRAGQYADFRDDVADGLGVAAVDAVAGVEDVPADDFSFQFLEHGGDAELVVFRLLAFREIVRHHFFLGLADRGVALLLDRNRVSGPQVLLDQPEHFLFQRAFVGDGDFARFLGGLLGKLDDRLDHRLEMPVPEHHGAEHDVFAQLLGFGLHHQDRVAGAGDDELKLGIDHLVERWIEHILVVHEADARRANRTLEGCAGQRQCRGRSHHRHHVGIVLHVVRKHCDDYLRFVAPAVREQRADRAVDQAGDQCLLLGGPAFALEIAAGNAARGVGLLLIVDGQRQEVDAFAGRFGGDDGGKDHGFAVGRQHGAVGLAGDFSGFKPEGTSTPVDFD